MSRGISWKEIAAAFQVGIYSVEVFVLFPRENEFDRDDGGYARRNVAAQAENFVVPETRDWVESEDDGLQTNGENCASASLPPSRS